MIGEESVEGRIFLTFDGTADLDRFVFFSAEFNTDLS